MSEIFRSVGHLQRALDFHLERHNVLASNVANVDTPGFRPHELVRRGAAPEEGRLSMQRTDGEHLNSRGTTAETGSAEWVEDTTTPAGNDGNAVSLDREMAKLAANDLRYDGAAKIVARQLTMLRYAANGGR